jgi:hypothetical protein
VRAFVVHEPFGIAALTSVERAVPQPGTRMGDRVADIFLPRWLDGELTPEKYVDALGGPAADGVLSEYRVFDEQAVVRVPDHLTDAEAPTLLVAGLTHGSRRAREGRHPRTRLSWGAARHQVAGPTLSPSCARRSQSVAAANSADGSHTHTSSLASTRTPRAVKNARTPSGETSIGRIGKK